MQDTWSWLFSTAGFMPHGHCYLWQPATLWLNVGSDGVIAAAYYTIPFTLYYFVRKRRAQIPYPGLLSMFALFILLCGTTHLMEIWTVWSPQYRAAGALKAATGLVSVLTMLALIRIMPQALLLRGPGQLQLEVEARTAELARVNAELIAQVAARDQAEAELRRQDQLKDEFFATLAHELRNPLAPIRHAVKIMADAHTGAQQQRWGREVIDRQANRMALLLDDLLDLSRIVRGRLHLKCAAVDLQTIVGTAVETIRPALEAKAQTLTLIDVERAVTLQADALRLSQALSNLLTNSVKYTPRGGHIEVRVERSDEHLIVLVKDDGVGFETASTSRLFQMFAREQSALDSTEGGLGIGLALVQRIVQLHGGRVHAHSRGPGLGAEFAIDLPATLVCAQPHPALAPAATAERAVGRARILIADDNRDAADSLGALLELDGHDVEVVYGGADALALARSWVPDVALLDIGMPDVNGYEVARAARGEEWGRTAYLVAVTGWGQAADKERARQAGFDLHLTKPVDSAVVEQLVRKGRAGAATGPTRSLPPLRRRFESGAALP